MALVHKNTNLKKNSKYPKRSSEKLYLGDPSPGSVAPSRRGLHSLGLSPLLAPSLTHRCEGPAHGTALRGSQPCLVSSGLLDVSPGTALGLPSSSSPHCPGCPVHPGPPGSPQGWAPRVVFLRSGLGLLLLGGGPGVWPSWLWQSDQDGCSLMVVTACCVP